jgi:hypothetical protein
MSKYYVAKYHIDGRDTLGIWKVNTETLPKTEHVIVEARNKKDAEIQGKRIFQLQNKFNESQK